MDTSSRSNIKIEDEKLYKYILKWIGKGEQSIDVLEKLLKSINVDMPVSFINPDYEYNFDLLYNRLKEIAFDIITNTGSILSVVMSFFDYSHNGIEHFKEITIGYDDQYNEYSYDKRGEKLNHECTKILYNDGDQVCYHYDYVTILETSLPFNLDKDTINKYQVQVSVEDSKDENHSASTRFMESAKKYLSDLDAPYNASTICNDICRMYDFHEEEIKLIPYIEIMVVQVAVDIVSIVIVKDGEIFKPNK